MPSLGTGPGSAFRQDILANRPAPTAALDGYFFFALDDGNGTLYQCNGTAWVAVSAAGAGKTVAAGTGISVVSTPTTVTINNTYTLPTASSSVLGGIKVGSGLAIDNNGVLSTAFNIPKASPTLLGGVKVGTGLSIDSTGVLSIILPVASSIGLGGIKVGSGLSIDGTGVLSVTGGGSGTVTSVGLTTPTGITVTGSPVTGAGTLALSWASEAQNTVLAGPSASSGTPGFRVLVAGDIPSLDAGKITTGALALARGGTGVDNSSISANLIWAGPSSGVAASATYRSLVAADIPALAASKITSGQLALTQGGTGLDTSLVTDGQLLIGQTSDHSWGRATLTAGTGISITNAGHAITIASTSTATVSSVGLSLPSIFSVSGSPVTTSGTLTGTLATQSANLIFAGPTTGVATAPTFRSLVAADIPSLPASQITSGALATARGGTGLDTSTAANGQLLIGNGTGLALAALTAGSGIAVTNAAGSVTVAASATNSKATASVDTTMTTAGTFYDGPTVSCVAGTWLLLASCTVLATTTAGKVTGKLWDGTTVLTSTEQPQVVSTTDSLTLAYVVSPVSTTTYKMSVTSTVASNTLKAACPDNGAGNNATWIVAIRIA